MGNSMKGKSFILSKLIGVHPPPDKYIKTEGLSIKYHNYGLVILDSAGIDKAMLNEGEEDYEYKDNNKGNKILNSKDKKNKGEEIDDEEIFNEKLKEKLITELFLQNYIINKSEILLIVVGIITFQEQKLLHRIKMFFIKNKIRKSLFIIHNLKELQQKNKFKII